MMRGAAPSKATVPQKPVIQEAPVKFRSGKHTAIVKEVFDITTKYPETYLIRFTFEHESVFDFDRGRPVHRDDGPHLGPGPRPRPRVPHGLRRPVRPRPHLPRPDREVGAGAPELPLLPDDLPTRDLGLEGPGRIRAEDLGERDQGPRAETGVHLRAPRHGRGRQQPLQAPRLRLRPVREMGLNPLTA